MCGKWFGRVGVGGKEKESSWLARTVFESYTQNSVMRCCIPLRYWRKMMLCPLLYFDMTTNPLGSAPLVHAHCMCKMQSSRCEHAWLVHARSQWVPHFTVCWRYTVNGRELNSISEHSKKFKFTARIFWRRFTFSFLKSTKRKIRTSNQQDRAFLLSSCEIQSWKQILEVIPVQEPLLNYAFKI